MKEAYRLYSDKEPVRREEVQRIIDEYNDGIRNNRFQRYSHIVDMIPANAGWVLDYGCGWGCIAKAIAEKGNKVIGIDQFDGAVEIARDFNSHDNVQFVRKGITEFDDESFDVVNSNQVLEHVHNPGIYLKNVNRVLKDGGYLVVSVPNVINFYYFRRQISRSQTEYFRKISADVLERYSKDSHHIQGWEPTTFVNLHASLGFGYVRHRYVEGMYLPYGKCKHVTVPWGGKYYHTRNRWLRNLSFTMIFKFRKVKFVDIQPED